MHSTELATFLADTLQIPAGTVLDRAKLLRAAQLLSKGKQGPHAGAVMGNTDASVSLFANLIEHRRGEDIAANVRRVRELRNDEPMLELPPGFTRGLTFVHATTAGAALDALLDDIRTGRMNKWAAGEPYKLFVTIDSRGASVFISLSKPKRHELDFRDATCGFAVPGYADRTRLIERNIAIGGDVFLKLADALDPMT